MRRFACSACLFAASSLVFMAGCDRSQPAADSRPAAENTGGSDHPAPRVPPEFKTDPTGKSIPMSDMLAAARQGQGSLPPGHPLIGATQPAGAMGTTLPAGHPPIGQGNAMVDDNQPPENMLDLKIPPTWTKRPTRPMTVAVYGLPKAEGSEDAELTVSHYPGMKNVPLEMQVQRWAGQFQQPDGKPTQDVLKQSKLEKAALPTTLIDITGRYTASSMMTGTKGPPKDNYEMMVGYVESNEGPWFFKLVGPQATIASHREQFLQLLREAK